MQGNFRMMLSLMNKTWTFFGNDTSAYEIDIYDLLNGHFLCRETLVKPKIRLAQPPGPTDVK